MIGHTITARRACSAAVVGLLLYGGARSGVGQSQLVVLVPQAQAHQVHHPAMRAAPGLADRIVHLKVAVMNQRGQRVLQREEWDALAPANTLPLFPRPFGNPTMLTKVRWIVTAPNGALWDQWWSPDTTRILTDYEVRAQHGDVYHAVVTPQGRVLRQPVSEFAVPASSNLSLRHLRLFKGIEVLAAATVGGAPVSVLRMATTHAQTAVTTTYYIAQSTQRLLKEEIITARAGHPVDTRIFALQSYEVLPSNEVPKALFNPSLPAGVPVANH